MQNHLLLNIFIFLAAACMVVPLASRLRLGSVLGYLAAGIAIGPFGLELITNSESIMHFAEFGVVMMLFMIGLELEPPTLWRLRKSVLGLGGLQVALTTAAISAIGVSLGFSWHASLAAGMALSLSSTALVLQMLQEKGLMQTEAGEKSFSVLLFQDIAVIPILILLPLLSLEGGKPIEAGWLTGFSGWQRAVISACAIAVIVAAGRYASRHVFRFIALTNLREVFTAVSLASVVGIALLMEMIGLSSALGAFIAGVVLASSEYRRTLETDIEPFKGLLLGLFFISIGMGMDFGLLKMQIYNIGSLVAGLIALKLFVLNILGRSFGMRGAQNGVFSIALAQGGEFAFVLFQYAGGLNILSAEQSACLTLVVALSMAATPFLMIVNDRILQPRFMSRLPVAQPDTITELNDVIIAGYGRFGQIIGRFLTAQNVRATILENDPDQIELLRKFGSRAYFGDASRLDLLRSAGASRAKLLVIAIDDADKILEIAKLARDHFPKLTVYARARNRRHAYELHKAGVKEYRRETFLSSLSMAQQVMNFLGHDAELMKQKADAFMQHDINTLRKSFEFFEKEPELISFARQASEELERILQNDKG